MSGWRYGDKLEIMEARKDVLEIMETSWRYEDKIRQAGDNGDKLEIWGQAGDMQTSWR